MQQWPAPSKRHGAVTLFPSAIIERWRRFRPRMLIVYSIGRNNRFAAAAGRARRASCAIKCDAEMRGAGDPSADHGRGWLISQTQLQGVRSKLEPEG
jgi:hypothetical protein